MGNIKNLIPTPVFVSLKFKKNLGYNLNLKNPKTYNEKLNWQKIYDHRDIYHEMVDKYKAKEYVSKYIDSKYIIPTYGVWNEFNEVNFSVLPDEFVLKTTHDSGGVVIIHNKNQMDLLKVQSIIQKSLNTNYFYVCREWPYKDLKPRIIAEKIISEETPNDYKFFMFNGKFDSVMVCSDRKNGHAKYRFYDRDWNRLMYMKPECEPAGDLSKPDNFDEMIDIAEKLSEGFPQLRVDLYNVAGKIYFGELTLFDEGGFDTEITYKTDLYWGSKINLDLIRSDM